MLFTELLSISKKCYENVDIPVALTDEKLEMQWANTEALRYFPSLSFKDGISDILHNYDIEKIMDLLKSGETFTTESIQGPLDISRLTVLPVLDGDLIGCLFIFNTKRRNYDLDNSDVQQNILSSFSESYKMPLTIIFSTLGLMARNVDENDNVTKTYIKLISQNCYRLYRMSNNIGDSVRFSSGVGALNLKNGDFAAFITGLCEAAGILTSAISIKLEIEVPDCQVITAFDSAKMSTVILNLISNAAKFTSESNRIKVKLEVIDKNAIVTVSDSGAGIKDEVIKHIFEPYFSYDPGGRSFSGNGLGLTLVKSIVALHGGTIAVRSRENEGTKVAFTLPIKLHSDAPDYTAESGIDYLSNRFSAVYVELSDICGSPMP